MARYEGLALRIIQTSTYTETVDNKKRRKSVSSVVWFMEWDTDNMPEQLYHPAVAQLDRFDSAAVVAYPDEFKLATDNDRERGRFTLVVLADGTKAYYRTDKRGYFVPRTYRRKSYLQEFICNPLARYIANYGLHDMGIDYSAADVARLHVRIEACSGVDVTAVGAKRHIH